eukprot:scaffold17.g504.t1
MEALLEEQHQPWEHVEEGVAPSISVEALFRQRPDHVLQTLSKQAGRRPAWGGGNQGVGHALAGRRAEARHTPAPNSSTRPAARHLTAPRPSALAQGVSKLGEFTEKEAVVLEAFNSDVLCTLGASSQVIDVETTWRRELRNLVPHKPPGWSQNVVVEAFVVNVQGASRPDKEGLLQPLLRRWQAGGVSLAVFGLPAVQAVVDYKWERMGRKLMLGELAFFLAWLLSFSAFTVIFQDEVVTYVLQFAITALHLGRWVLSGWISVMCAAQVVLLLFRLQWFSRCFASTRFQFVETVILGFGVAFHVLFRLDQEATEGFDSIWDAFLTMFAAQGSLLDLKMTRSTHNPGAATTLAVCYYFCVGMVLLNLLIGIMSNAMARSSEHEALKLILSKVQVIDELESTLPPWIERRFASSWYPDYIHILRVDPDRVGRVDLDSLWAKAGDPQLVRARAEGGASGRGEPPGGGNGGSRDGGNARDTEVQQRLDALQKQLSRVEGLLLAVQAGLAQQARSADGGEHVWDVRAGGTHGSQPLAALVGALATAATRKGSFWWAVQQFSSLEQEVESPSFFVGGAEWRLVLCPKGSLSPKGTHAHLSLFLKCLRKAALPLKATYTLTVHGATAAHDTTKSSTDTFDPEDALEGFRSFVALERLRDPARGHLRGDALWVSAKVAVL